MAFGKVERADNSSLPHLKILVVDDDDLNRRMMHILLTREGHQVHLAASGMDALEAVKRQQYDIVFMDLQMPIMDGIETSCRIREWENGGRHTFIVALTASYLPEKGDLLFKAGIDNYIAKPLEVEHIDRMLSYISRGALPASEHVTAMVDESSASSRVLNVQKGTDTVGGDQEAYRELLRDFIRELPQRVAMLEKHLVAGNWAAVSFGAHNMKGIASSLGAFELADYAAKLDKQGKEGYTDPDSGLMLELKRVERNLQKMASDFLT